jgi:anaerobic magnesium-protoporphyrin IX monomethyl ester cyclase
MVKEKSRIILFNPKPTFTDRRVLPVGLLAISSFLAEDVGKYNIQIYDFFDNDYLDAIKDLDDVICVGITSMTGHQITDGLRFAKLVKDNDSSIPIVWGGIHPTIMPIQTIKNPYVDIVVRGQGEITFYELVRCLESGGELDKISGIVFKKNGKIFENEPRPISDINNFPKLPYHLLGEKLRSFIRTSTYGKRYLPIITSDGCPFNCSFCFMSMPQFRRKYVSYSVERVLDEIEYLVKEHHIEELDIRDTNFFINTARTRSLLEGLIRRNLKVFLTGVNARVDQLLNLDGDFWKLMESAGMKELMIGAESGDQEMLDMINKRITVEQIRDCLKKAFKHKINIINSFITGYPIKAGSDNEYEKKLNKELYSTIDLIDDIIGINPLASNLIFIYTPYPGTSLYQYCLECGFKEPETLEEWGALDLNRKHFPWMSDSHINKISYYNKLLLIKKLTSKTYVGKKIGQGSKIYKILNYLGLLRVMNLLVSFRIKRKITFLPIEKYLLN